MSYYSFDGQEGEFEEWVLNHPGGIVINSRPNRLNSAYLIAHRPRCESFWKHLGATTNYSKHCFDSTAEALEFLHSKSFGRPSFGCTSCKVAALEPTAEREEFDERVASLLTMGVSQDPPGNLHPRKIELSGNYGYYRDPLVAARILQYAAGKCELCKANAPFLTRKGSPYLEIHHVKRLADLGSDTVSNTVALCPNCHRALHCAKDAPAISTVLYDSLPRLSRS